MMKVCRCWLPIIPFGVLLLFSPSRSGGQAIRGTVLDNESGMPVDGASVMLVDLDQKIATGVLSDSAGAFIMIAPRTGRYVVRCER
ncbi:carboxypeptidase-like regulatory domain-containing protein, partial [Gemmatimonadota bacterium]